MPEHKPLYLYSLKEAAEWDEKDEWRESYLENCDCARAIERAVDEHYDGQCLKSCAKEIIDRYGFERVNFVLASTLRQSIEDGRYSEDNKNGRGAFPLWTRKTHGNTVCAVIQGSSISLSPTQGDSGINSDYMTAVSVTVSAADSSTIPIAYLY